MHETLITKDGKKIDLDFELEMIEGNKNRMCVTDDLGELRSMRDFLILRANAIFEYNLIRLEKEKGE